MDATSEITSAEHRISTSTRNMGMGMKHTRVTVENIGPLVAKDKKDGTKKSKLFETGVD